MVAQLDKDHKDHIWGLVDARWEDVHILYKWSPALDSWQYQKSPFTTSQAWMTCNVKKPTAPSGYEFYILSNGEGMSLNPDKFPGAPGGVSGARCAGCRQHERIDELKSKLAQANQLIESLAEHLVLQSKERRKNDERQKPPTTVGSER